MKIFTLILLFLSLLYSDINEQIKNSVQEFLGVQTYQKNKALIELLFKNTNRFIYNNSVRDIEVLSTLKENGLLPIYFKTPQNLEIEFYAKEHELLLIQLLDSTLRTMGYYKYFITESKRDKDYFSFAISMHTEYNIDPTLLKNLLYQRGCVIKNIDKVSQTKWRYEFDVENVKLDSQIIYANQEVKINKPVYPILLNIEDGKQISIYSSNGNHWYPNISLYDKYLNLIKLYQRDKKTKKLKFKFTDSSRYIKIGDLYQMNNLRYGLKINLQGER